VVSVNGSQLHQALRLAVRVRRDHRRFGRLDAGTDGARLPWGALPREEDEDP